MASKVETCRVCGRMFTYPGFGGLLCASCRTVDDQEFEKVRTFLNENGTANMYEISIATGVPEKTIRRYLTESRLEIPEGSPIFIKCSSCGCDIRSGKYCADCAARLSNDLQGCFTAFVGDKPKGTEEKTGKMRFLKTKGKKK